MKEKLKIFLIGALGALTAFVLIVVLVHLYQDHQLIDSIRAQIIQNQANQKQENKVDKSK